MVYTTLDSWKNSQNKINETNSSNKGYYITSKGKKVEFEDEYTLFINNKDIVELNLFNNISLVNLYCANNKIRKLDVSNCKKLLFINCEKNQLTELDVSNCEDLNELYCDKNVKIIGFKKEEEEKEYKQREDNRRKNRKDYEIIWDDITTIFNNMIEYKYTDIKIKGNNELYFTYEAQLDTQHDGIEPLIKLIKSKFKNTNYIIYLKYEDRNTESDFIKVI